MSAQVVLPYEERTLANGLRVIVHADPALPLVAVNLWYHVGSRNEKPGRTGFAHLFEHLMFEGSAHVPAGHFDSLLEEAGATNNGSTSPDRTNYWETLPSHALELALWLESDRMGWLAAAMTQEKLDAQRDVVMNERRESYENRPYGLAYETILAALYPPEHPYHWPTIGSMADLEAAGLDEVLAFFATYYRPNNASLAIAGAVDPARALDLAEQWFGELPAGPPVAPVLASPATLTEERRVVLEDDVQLARLYLVWHSPRTFAADDAELDLAAHILARGKTARLHRRLVHDLEIAHEVRAFQDSGQLGSGFFVVVTARPGVGLAESEAVVREELGSLADVGPSDAELERARNAIETQFVDAIQTVGGFGGKADRLNLYAFHTGDPGFVARDLARYTAADSPAIARAVSTHLIESPPVVLGVVPRGSGSPFRGGSSG